MKNNGAIETIILTIVSVPFEGHCCVESFLCVYLKEPCNSHPIKRKCESQITRKQSCNYGTTCLVNHLKINVTLIHQYYI